MASTSCYVLFSVLECLYLFLGIYLRISTTCLQLFPHLESVSNLHFRELFAFCHICLFWSLLIPLYLHQHDIWHLLQIWWSDGHNFPSLWPASHECVKSLVGWRTICWRDESSSTPSSPLPSLSPSKVDHRIDGLLKSPTTILSPGLSIFVIS